MNSSPVLLLLGFLEAQTSKRSARKFFSRQFSIQTSEWASFISFTHFCVSHNLGFTFGFLEALSIKRSARKFFSRHLSVRISEWATYTSLFVSWITHICIPHNLVSQTIYILSLYGQTKRSQFFSRHFSVRFSEWATYISLSVYCITHIWVSHNSESHISHMLCPCMDKQNTRIFSLNIFPSEFQSGRPT